jgi:hypothetical protein
MAEDRQEIDKHIVSIITDREDGKGYISPLTLAYLQIPVYLEILGEKFRITGWNETIGVFEVQREE